MEAVGVEMRQENLTYEEGQWKDIEDELEKTSREIMERDKDFGRDVLELGGEI